MAFEVRVPAVGESVSEGEVYKWHKADGDYVAMDDVLVELETDKATVEIVAEASGVIKLQKKEGDTVTVGDVLATIDTDAKKADKKPAAEPAAKAPEPEPAPAQKAKAPAAKSDQPLSPAVGRMVAEHALDPAQIGGTGRSGRITKGDVIEHMERGAAPAAAKAPEAKKPTSLPVEPPRPAAMTARGGERREKMTRIRQRIAERLVESQQTTAMLTTFNEIDMSAVMNLRKAYKDRFKDVHGVNLGFMSFFVKAAVEALKTYPEINGWVEGQEVVYHDYYDVGVAVSTDRGLMVPVVRDCDKLGFADVEKAILHYALKARDGKISLDDLSGGTFTISNGGTFGSLLSTPILNPPQSGILGMHKIEERPVVVNGQIVIRPMMYVALSYDHRIVDGKGAVGFLVKIKECIEDPSRLLLGV